MKLASHTKAIRDRRLANRRRADARHDEIRRRGGGIPFQNLPSTKNIMRRLVGLPTEGEMLARYIEQIGE